MRHFLIPTLLVSLLAGFALPAHAQAPALRWDVQQADPKTADWYIYRGESVELMPRLVDGTQPAAITNTPATLRYREPTLPPGQYREVAATNVAAGTWAIPWSPELDAGALWYDYQLWVGEGSSFNNRIAGKIIMRESIGIPPAGEPPPPVAGYATPADIAAATNALAAVAHSGSYRDLADTPPPPPPPPDPAAAIAAWAPTGHVASADSATTANAVTGPQADQIAAALQPADLNAATGSLATVAHSGSYTDLTNLPPPPEPPDLTPYIRRDASNNVVASEFKISGTRTALPPIGKKTFDLSADEIEYAAQHKTAKLSPKGLLVEQQFPQKTTLYTAEAIESDNTIFQLPARNNGDTLATLGDISDAIGAANWPSPAIVTNIATDVATPIAQSAAATAADTIIQTYFVAPNAWITVSNDVFSVWHIDQLGSTNMVWASTQTQGSMAQEIADLRTQVETLSQQVAMSVAWGDRAPDGTPNPDPSYMLYINKPSTMHAAGYEWATYGAYAVLAASGAVAWESGLDGGLRIGPDLAENYFGFTAGGSVLVGAHTAGIEVLDGGTEEGLAYLTYAYSGGDWPVLMFSTDLRVPFAPQSGIVWQDNLDGTATATAPATAERGYWYGLTSIAIGHTFISTMPANFAGGVFGSTNSLPVRYDTTITIESGGSSYRIPAEAIP